MAKRILTLDDLYEFFVEQNKFVNFNSKESGTPIVVTINGTFAEEKDEMPGMLKLKLKVCHTNLNRNGSFISKENMEKAMPTLKYRPILAYIHELDDGTKDFYAHNMKVVEKEDGESEIVYIEKQVGCFTADEPWLEYDEEMDKTYVIAYAVIPEEYTETADIIRRKNGTKVSCELVINELSYNAKEKYLDLTDFYFSATTLLGKDEDGNEIGEGMLGSRADIEDFCHKEPVYTYQDKMIEVLDKLNTTLSNFNKDTIQKGGNEMNKFEELLQKYNKVAEDVTFEVEGLSDEELEAAFEAAFNEVPAVEPVTESVAEPVADFTTDPEPAAQPVVEEKFSKTFTVELSHDDIRCALYNLIAQYEEEDNEWYSIEDVYNSYFYMQGWINNKLYKIGYSVDGESVALEGERQEMFDLIVSESEKLAIEKMREDYAALESKYNELKTFKDNYDAAQLKAEKDAIFASAEYAEIKNTDGFKALIADMDKYSVEEIREKADLLFAAAMKQKFSFEAKQEEKPHSVGVNFNVKPNKKRQAYAGLFDE